MEPDEPSHPGPGGGRHVPPRTSGRDELLEAARRLLSSATFDDLASFVTVRRLTDATGLSSGAVYSAFQPEPGVDGRSRSAPQAAARRAMQDAAAVVDEQTDGVSSLIADAIAEHDADVGALLEWLASSLAAPMVAAARATDGDDGWWFTQMLLAAAVVPNDPEIAEVFGEIERRSDRLIEPAAAAMLEYTGRELVDGLDLNGFAGLFNVALEGCALRLRLDPDSDPSALPTMYQALWIALTRRADARDDRHVQQLAVPGWRPLSAQEDAAVRAAVRRVTERAGWAAVTVAKVAQLAGVAESRLAGHYSTRHELAPIVWSEILDGLERRAQARAGLAPVERLAGLVDDIVDAACSQRALVASLLIARLQSTSLSVEENLDPPTVRIAALLADAFDDAYTGGADGSVPAEVAERHRLMSRATTDLILSRAAMADDTVEELMWLVLDGLSGFDIAIPDRVVDTSAQ